MTRIVYGVTLTTLTSPFLVPGIQAQHEHLGQEQLRERFRLEPQAQQWRHEAASVWTDPDTGEEFEMPERWLLLVEGWSE